MVHVLTHVLAGHAYALVDLQGEPVKVMWMNVFPTLANMAAHVKMKSICSIVIVCQDMMDLCVRIMLMTA
jgi:hypothetical protein